MRGATSRTAGSGWRPAGPGNGKQRRATVAAQSAEATGPDADAMRTLAGPVRSLPDGAGTGSGIGSVTAPADQIRRALRLAAWLAAALRTRLAAAWTSLRERWVR